MLRRKIGPKFEGELYGADGYNGENEEKHPEQAWHWDEECKLPPPSPDGGDGGSLDEHGQRRYSLPTLVEVNAILQARGITNEAAKASVMAKWQQLITMQWHYIDGTKQQRFLRELVEVLPADTFVVIADYAEDVKTGRAKRTPKDQYTRHSILALFCAAFIRRSNITGDIEIMYASVFCYVTNKDGYCAAGAMETLLRNPTVAAFVAGCTSMESFTDAGQGLAGYEYVTFILRNRTSSPLL